MKDRKPRAPRTVAPINRRAFLAGAGGAIAALHLPQAACPLEASMQPQAPDEAIAPPGIDLRTIIEAEKLARVEFTNSEREQILRGVDDWLALYDIIREATLENHEGPAEVFDPRLPRMSFSTERRPARFAAPPRRPLPPDERDIAFAPLADLSQWVRSRQITSVELTTLSLKRLRAIGPKLECVVTLMEESALEQARRADAEIAAGRYRGPLHGVPWGVKDLFDTAGVRTTWGAEPFKDRVPVRDATIVRRLNDAGAILVAKLTLGALAYGDIWFGGKTRNPFNLEQGSSGSSAGSAAAVAAGLCAFTIGTETYGSIMSPSARCGATGFRPTFGRVSRAGAMALCWSLDKVGPICRSADDCAMVLDAIAGPDDADESTIDLPLNIDMTRRLEGLRVGHLKSDYDAVGDEHDAATLRALESAGCELTPVSIDAAPYGQLIFFIIAVEAAAAFDELTRLNLDDQMKWQDDAAWPNTFRATRLGSVVDFMNARRLRRRFMAQMAALFDNVDIVIAPSRHGAMHALTNMTGHPAITVRQAFRDNGTPRAVTMWGRLFGDATLLAVGAAVERALGVRDRRPEIDESR